MATLDEVKKIVEALLLVSDDPLTEQQIINVIEADAEKQRELLDLVPRALCSIEEECQSRPYELVEVKSGFRLQIRTEMSEWIAKLLRLKPRKYTQATLETLVLIAYRQPITRGEIEQIRGVGVNTNTLRTLMDRGWVKVLGTKEVAGRPKTYGTTAEFLNYFGLKSITELPELPDSEQLSVHAVDLGIAAELSVDTDTNDISSESEPRQ